MTIRVINLNKLLKLCALPDNKLVGEIRTELRNERDKLLKIKKSGGGHFHHPWWTAAKHHTLGLVDLEEMTEILVEDKNQKRQRKRLYPLLTAGFLRWLEYLGRSTNQKIVWTEDKVHTHYSVPGYDLTVKVDNVLALKWGDDGHKIVYPYFSEQPQLVERWARVGLWLMQEALPKAAPADIEILDVLRGRSFGGSTMVLRGDEEAIFQRRFEEIEAIWEELKVEYGL